MIKNKKFIIDMMLNITAVGLPIAVLQLVVYPITAKLISGDSYGLMLTIYSVWVMISNSIGNALNNIRLLKGNEYKERELEGDFQDLLSVWNIFNAVILFIFLIVYEGGFSILHVTLGLIISVLFLTRAYIEVEFRIHLNYKAIVIEHILQCIGHLAGLGLLLATGIWEWIFLLGYLFSVTYCVRKTSLLKEKRGKTVLYKQTRNDFYSLIVSTIISNITKYADKLVLYPLMGGTAVAIYYTATIIGKITGMLTNPINSVILSYISRWNQDKRGIYIKVVAVSCVIGLVGYGVTMLLGRPVIGFLFPQWVDEVMIYLPVTTIAVMLGVVTSILHPFVLKFCAMKWQIIINLVASIVYFVFALLLWRSMGLMGFCIGTVIGMLSKFIMMIVVYFYRPDIKET